MKRKFYFGLMAAVAVVLMLAPLSGFARGLTKPVSKNPEAQKLLDEAWELDRSEDDSAEAYRKCIELTEKADKLDPNNPMILIELSRYYWNYGNSLPKETKQQQKQLESIYAKALGFAERSLKIKTTVDAHYWIAVNRAAGLEFSSILAQAAAFPVIYRHSQYVSDNEPNYYYGATGRLWSEILVRVPKRVVELVGWDVNEAVEDINKAIAAEPRFLDNYVYKARFLHVYFGNDEEALEILDHVLKQKPDCFPEEVGANKVAQKDARKLWKDITGKDYPNK